MEKKYLVVGNMGYVGSVLTKHLRKQEPNAFLIGYDLGIFSHCLSSDCQIPELCLDIQYFGDARSFDRKVLDGCDGVVYLAAISNDPMGKMYESLTDEVNNRSCIRWAKAAKDAGVRSFVLASSCSVYGTADDSPKKETDPLDPLTAYARSKINAETSLEKIADKSFYITCLRFATACGMSDRLRTDLVLNDFVFNVLENRKINILSNGKPWRPLIDVSDMARAIQWGLQREGDNFLTINAGSSEWNFQVLALAENVQSFFPDALISINENAPEDNRSYRVDFSLFEKLAFNYRVNISIKDSIMNLVDGIKSIQSKNLDKSSFIRLSVLKKYLENNSVV